MMRQWFHELPFVRDKGDCRVLNCAARNLWPAPRKPPHKDLTTLAMLYKRGMSAAVLMERFEDAFTG